MWLLLRENTHLVFSEYSDDWDSLKPDGKLLYS